VKRLSILIVALTIGAAAPARAWCEATCLEQAAHPGSAKPHCPLHESTPSGPSLSAADSVDCPSIESARPTQAKLDSALAPIGVTARTLAAMHPGTQAPSHPRHFRQLRHLSSIPLRI